MKLSNIEAFKFKKKIDETIEALIAFVCIEFDWDNFIVFDMGIGECETKVFCKIIRKNAVTIKEEKAEHIKVVCPKFDEGIPYVYFVCQWPGLYRYEYVVVWAKIPNKVRFDFYRSPIKEEDKDIDLWICFRKEVV